MGTGFQAQEKEVSQIVDKEMQIRVRRASLNFVPIVNEMKKTQNSEDSCKTQRRNQARRGPDGKKWLKTSNAGQSLKIALEDEEVKIRAR